MPVSDTRYIYKDALTPDKKTRIALFTRAIFHQLLKLRLLNVRQTKCDIAYVLAFCLYLNLP